MFDCKKNAFELFGYDLMVDNEFNVWLIEVNSSPGLKGIEETTNIDVASKIIEYIEQNKDLTQRKKKDKIGV